MANKTISDLRELSTVSNSNVLVVETNAETFKVTKENLLKEVNEELNTKSNINHTHDEYVTESELNAKGLATETFVESEISKIELTPGPQGPKGPKGDKGDPGTTTWEGITNKPTNLATETFVTQKIAEASLSGGDVDLSDYATIDFVTQKIAEASLSGGNLVFRDIFEGEKFEINEDNVVAPPTDVYGNILISTTTLSFAENASTTFTVKLDKAPTNNQVVNLSVNNAYCTLNKTSLTFTPSNYSTAQTVTVAGVHDSNNYSNKTSIINLTSPNVANKTISVTIKNADTPPVVTVPVTGVSLSPSAHTMKVGQTIRLTATVSPSDATNKNVTWNVNNANATVVDGLVTAKNEGECIITVTTEDGNKTAACQMVIEAKNENDEEYPIDVIPVIDLDVANWDETTTLTDKRGNYHFAIDDISKYSKTEDGGIFITSSRPARSTFATPGSYSVRIKMKFTQLPGAYGRFWRWENDTPSLYVEAAKQVLTFKAAGSSAQAYRISTTKTYVNELVDVVCCFDGATKEIGMYINGEKVGLQSGTQASGGGNTLTIGNIDTNAYNIDFAMYAFQVYDTALSEDQIRGL